MVFPLRIAALSMIHPIRGNLHHPTIFTAALPLLYFSGKSFLSILQYLRVLTRLNLLTLEFKQNHC